MDEDLFEKITNAIAVLLRDDTDLTTYCTAKLGSPLNPVDNSITKVEHKEQIPFFVITKGEEDHFFNRGTESGLKNLFDCQIIFFGDFAGTQVNNNAFNLPVGAKETINGIKTYTPSDTMRKIGRMAGFIVNKKIECSVPQVRVENFKVFAEGYYDRESGAVGSVLDIKLYMENRGYNN